MASRLQTSSPSHYALLSQNWQNYSGYRAADACGGCAGRRGCPERRLHASDVALTALRTLESRLGHDNTRIPEYRNAPQLPWHAAGTS